MNKENRCAASLRRSAVVERIRLREEWSALKGTKNEKEPYQKQKNKKSRRNLNVNSALLPHKSTEINRKIDRYDKQICDVLRGIVVLVEVGSASRALALRAALSALGASVVPAWSPLVTHLVWTQGGCRNIRAKARALACQLVSPLWVEACAAEGRKLPERIFPPPSRPSDLPSPATLRRLLKKAEHENIPLQNLLPDSQGSDKTRPARLRLSSDTDHDTTNTTNTSQDVSKESSQDSPDIKTRVNTALRRPHQKPIHPQKPTKSKRKLFTQKEPQLQTTDDENVSDNEPAGPKKTQQLKITLTKNLAQAERLAKHLMGTTPAKKVHACINTPMHGTQLSKPPRIVLTGMSRAERHEAWRAIKELNGKVQDHVDKKTTHVILGSCHEPDQTSPTLTRESPKTNKSPETNGRNNLTICSQCSSPGKILTYMFARNVTVENNVKNITTDKILCTCKNNDISGVNYLLNNSKDSLQNNKGNRDSAHRTQSNSVLNAVNQNAQSSDNDGSSDKILHYAKRKPKRSHVLSLSRRNTRNNDLNCMTASAQRNIKNVKNTQSTDIFASDNGQSNDIDYGRDTETNILCPVRGNAENKFSSVKGNAQSNELSSAQANKIITVADNRQNDVCSLETVVKKPKPRTVNVLLGAARGCRVLGSEWVKDSLKANRWLQHVGYEVPYLKKMSQKARAERSALNKIHSDYAYNVFNGMRIRISPDAEQKDAITQLLTLCGAVIHNDSVSVENVQNVQKTQHNGFKITFNNLINRVDGKQNGGLNVKRVDVRKKHGRFGAQSQNGGICQDGGRIQGSGVTADLTIGRGNGDVMSKWVFDSVAAARMRTTRRYIINTYVYL